jgi:hypothetical protein
MAQYSVNFFTRDLAFVHNDSASISELSEDYISLQNNTVEIGLTEKVKNGQLIHLKNELNTFLGVVTNVKPGFDTLMVTYKSVLSLFDEDILFDTDLQKQTTTDPSGGAKINSKSLEQMLKDTIEEIYVYSDDSLQNLNLVILVETNTPRWGFNLKSDTEGTHYCIIGLYGVLLVNALKKYGVALSIVPDFENRCLLVYIRAQSGYNVLDIDGDLSNVTIKTLKMNDRPNGTNKLTVYNTDDYGQCVDFYVHTDRSWDSEDTDRITPVVRDVRAAMPDGEIEDPNEAFLVSAVDVAYGVLSGQAWNNLIELEVAPEDEAVHPLTLFFGQSIRLWYKDGVYESILTGRSITETSVVLTFGSERISFTKRYKPQGGT